MLSNVVVHKLLEGKLELPREEIVLAETLLHHVLIIHMHFEQFLDYAGVVEHELNRAFLLSRRLALLRSGCDDSLARLDEIELELVCNGL